MTQMDIQAKLKKFSLALIGMLIGLFILAMLQPDWRAGIDIFSRFVLAVFCFASAGWMVREPRYRFVSIIIALVGIGLVVTAVMGYGFNGSAPTPWLWGG